MGTSRAAMSPSVAEQELTARGDSGAGLWFLVRYSTVGDLCPSPIAQGLLGGLAHSYSTNFRFKEKCSWSTSFRFSVKEFVFEKELDDSQRVGKVGEGRRCRAGDKGGWERPPGEVRHLTGESGQLHPPSSLS